MLDLSKSDEAFLSDRFKDYLTVASRDFRRGFMDGVACNTKPTLQPTPTYQATPTAMP